MEHLTNLVYDFSEKIDKYRLQLVIVTFVTFIITAWWGPNTESSWVMLPFTIGCIFLFFGMKGEYLILSLEDGPFIFASLGMVFAAVYVGAGTFLFGLAAFFVSFID